MYNTTLKTIALALAVLAVFALACSCGENKVEENKVEKIDSILQNHVWAEFTGSDLFDAKLYFKFEDGTIYTVEEIHGQQVGYWKANGEYEIGDSAITINGNTVLTFEYNNGELTLKHDGKILDPS